MLNLRFIPMLLAGLITIPTWAQVSAPDTLMAHNAERQNYPGVGPLQWSPELEQYAQSWANSLALQNVFQHRPSTKDNPLAPGHSVGENNAFAKLKAVLRKAAARTIDELWQAIRDALPQFTPAECANYFLAAGYKPD